MIESKNQENPTETENSPTLSHNEVRNNLKLWRIILPVVIGLAVIIWLIFRDLQTVDFSILKFSYLFILFIFMAFLMMVIRDYGYIIRLQVLSEKELSLRKCLRIIMLWEFTSAITPSAVGGTALATIFIWKEGLEIGKSTSIVVATSFLDELYFSLFFPIVFFVAGSALFPDNNSIFYNNLIYFTIAGYIIKLLWTILMGYSIFVNPAVFSKMIKKIFNIRLIKRWKNAAYNMANGFETSNIELKNKSFKFWGKAFLFSFFSWTARFFVINFILIAFAFLSNSSLDNFMSIENQFLIFARQLSMWIMMLVLPTPGGAGFSEIIFSSYLKDLISLQGFTSFLALAWRLITYYPYLIIGIFIVPKWIYKHYKIKPKTTKIE